MKEFFESLRSNTPSEAIVRCPYHRMKEELPKPIDVMMGELVYNDGVSPQDAAQVLVAMERNYRVKVFLTQFLSYLSEQGQEEIDKLVLSKKGMVEYRAKLDIYRLIHAAYIWQAHCMNHQDEQISFKDYNNDILEPTLTPETINNQKENQEIVFMAGYEPLISAVLDLLLMLLKEDQFIQATQEEKKKIFMSVIPSLERFAIVFSAKIPFNESIMKRASSVPYGVCSSFQEDAFLLQDGTVVFNPKYTDVDKKKLGEKKIVHKGCLAAYVFDSETGGSLLSSQTRVIMNLVFELFVEKS